jgi:hypothetical protein
MPLNRARPYCSSASMRSIELLIAAMLLEALGSFLTKTM